MKENNLLTISTILRKMHKMLTDKQKMQIAAEASCDPRTVASIYEGRRSKGLVRFRVVEAAKKLKIARPPKEKE